MWQAQMKPRKILYTSWHFGICCPFITCSYPIAVTRRNTSFINLQRPYAVENSECLRVNHCTSRCKRSCCGNSGKLAGHVLGETSRHVNAEYLLPYPSLSTTNTTSKFVLHIIFNLHYVCLRTDSHRRTRGYCGDQLGWYRQCTRGSNQG